MSLIKRDLIFSRKRVRILLRSALAVDLFVSLERQKALAEDRLPRLLMLLMREMNILKKREFIFRFAAMAVSFMTTI